MTRVTYNVSIAIDADIIASNCMSKQHGEEVNFTSIEGEEHELLMALSTEMLK